MAVHPSLLACSYPFYTDSIFVPIFYGLLKLSQIWQNPQPHPRLHLALHSYGHSQLQYHQRHLSPAPG